MKIKGKSIVMTAGLICILILVLLIEISIFISGPSRKYEDKIQTQIDAIEKNNTDVKIISRHVFQFITYIGEEENAYVWFNTEGEEILSKSKASYDEKRVITAVNKQYGVTKATITLGYGYENAVYIVESEKGVILLDYDTLEEVYYLKEGE